MDYIKIESIYNKINNSVKENKILYISGSVGMGKTASVKYYFRRKNALYLSTEKGAVKSAPKLDDIPEDVIIFDDISEISNKASKEYILDAIEQNKKQIILIGRGMPPKWLVPASLKHFFSYADNSDLVFSDKEIRLLFENNANGKVPDSDDLETIKEQTHLNTAALIFVVSHMAVAPAFTDSYIRSAGLDFNYYLDDALYDRLDEDVQKAFLNVCLFDKFNVGLLKHILNKKNVHALLTKMEQCADIIDPDGDGGYLIKPFYKEYFDYKVKTLYTDEEINGIYNRATDYYLANDMPFDAMACFRKTGDLKKLEKLLSDYTREHPGQETFRELLPNYMALPKDVIRKYPCMMSGFSKSFSLALNIKNSEYWYDALCEYAGNKKNPALGRKQATAYIAYLDISLPHRNPSTLFEDFETILNLPETLKSTFTGPQSIIDSTPSVINGAVDLSETLLKYDTKLSDPEFTSAMGETMDAVFGDQASCLIDILTAEYGYETDTLDEHTISALAGSSFQQASAKGATQMCCVAGALMIRAFLDTGQFNTANNMFKNYYKNASEKGYSFVLHGLELFGIWLEMINGNNNPAKKWLENVTYSTEPSLLDRQNDLLKIRTLIALQRFDEALMQILRIEPIFDLYNRPYNSIQVHILHAIALYHRGIAQWKNELSTAVSLASKFGYLHVIADEGAAVKPLLDSCPLKDVPSNYLSKLKELTNARAMHFPNYMRPVSALENPLTETETKVIRLMCQELPSEEICDALCISYSGLKFHRQNIYKKLHAGNRHEAQRIAKSLGLNL